jgi:hypothetical protein
MVCYCLSLTQDAFYIDRVDHNAWSSGLWLLLIGWLGALMGSGAALTWLANPVLFFSWFLLSGNTKSAVLAGVAASIIALSFLLFTEVITSEAPTYSTITFYGLGYWLWLSSCLIIAIGATILYRLSHE